MVDPSAIVSNVTRHDGIWWCDRHTPVSYTYVSIEDGSFWFRHRNRCILEAVVRYGTTTEPFLEIGGGNGYVTRAIGSAGFETVMIEPDPAGIANARQRGLRHLICAPFEDCVFSGRSVGAVGVFDVIEHVRNDVEFLEKIRSLLHAGGVLFATVPACPQLWSAEDIHDGHYRRYTVHSLKEKLKSAGFACTYTTSFFRLLAGPIFLFRTAPYLLRLKRRQHPATYRRENGMTTPFLSNLILHLLRSEATMIRRGTSARFGASILVVAQ
jgi:SAM-dependent methyltransferase